MTKISSHKSCGRRCLTTYGDAHGAIFAVLITEHRAGKGLCSFSGFKVLAVYCRHHERDASHTINEAKHNGRRFVQGALIGRQTVAELLTEVKR